MTGGFGFAVVGAAGLGGFAGLLASRRAVRWAEGRPVPPSRVLLPPAVTAVLGSLAAGGTVWRWGVGLRSVPLLLLGWVCVAATDIDLRAHVIPDRLTLRAPLVLAAAIGLAVVEVGAGGLVRAVVAALALPGGLLATSLLFLRARGEAGIGLGDVKLALSLGLVLGWLGGAFVAVALVATFVAAGAAVAALLAARRVDLSDRIPFGPYLAVGTMASVVGGEPLARWGTALLTG